MSKSNEVMIYTKSEITKADQILLNAEQIDMILKKTPKKHIYQKPGPGGMKFSYVKGIYVKKILNFMFGWDWSFEVVEHKFDLQVNQVYVLGKLTIPLKDGRKIVKMQFGTADVKIKKSTGKPLNIGNDLKGATTDALKKCASELGLFSDVYSPEDYHEIRVQEDIEISLETLKDLFDKHGERLHGDDQMNIERIIDQKEESSYGKAIKELRKYE